MKVSWGELYLLEMFINCVASTIWALASGWNAIRNDRLWSWPVPWRLLVFNWMAFKATFFWLLFLEVWLTPTPPPPPLLPDVWVESVLGCFTVAHTWALWRWFHLDPGPPETKGVK